MALSAPLVSIGVPVFNEAGSIASALDSILGQTYSNIEIIVSDNASTDATRDICLEYERREPRVRYHRNPANLGSVENFNRTFALAQGKYFCWAGGHDERRSDFVARCVDVLEREPSVVLCHTGADVPAGHTRDALDTRELADDAVSRFHAALWYIRGGWPIYGMHRTAALARTRLLAPVVACDVALLAELALLGTFAYVAEPMLRPGHGNGSGDWRTYLARMKAPARGPAGHYLAFGRAMVGAVWRSDLPAHGKAACCLSVALALAYKHRSLYGALRAHR